MDALETRVCKIYMAVFLLCSTGRKSSGRAEGTYPGQLKRIAVSFPSGSGFVLFIGLIFACHPDPHIPRLRRRPEMENQVSSCSSTS